MLRREGVTDGRVTIVSVTEKGQELDQLSSFYEMINDTLFQGFTSVERNQALDLLRCMEANAEAALKG